MPSYSSVTCIATFKLEAGVSDSTEASLVVGTDGSGAGMSAGVGAGVGALGCIRLSLLVDWCYDIFYLSTY